MRARAIAVPGAARRRSLVAARKPPKMASGGTLLERAEVAPAGDVTVKTPKSLPAGIVRDVVYPNMYRIRLPGGGLSTCLT
jgi:hypothetical protein